MMFRKGILVAAGVAGLTVSAQAADLATEAPAAVPAPVAYNWSGFYVGAQVGYGFGEDRTRQFAPANLGGLNIGSSNLNADGVLGGIHLGYNFQHEQWVFGVEADFEGTDLNSGTRAFPSGDLARENVNWQGSVRGRVGYAFDRVLFYATGGLAYGELENRYLNGVTGVAQSFTGTRLGYTVGGGLEYAIDNHWTTRLEYRYTEFDRVNNTVSLGSSIPGSVFNQRPDFHTVRIGVSYKF